MPLPVFFLCPLLFGINLQFARPNFFILRVLTHRVKALALV